MLDADNPSNDNTSTTIPAEPTSTTLDAPVDGAPAAKKTAKKAAKKAPAKKAAKKVAEGADAAEAPEGGEAPKKKAAKKTPAKKTAKKATDAAPEAPAGESGAATGAPMVLFQAPEKTAAPARKRAAKQTAESADAGAEGAEAATEGDGAPAKKAAAKKTAAKKTAAKKTAKKTAAADEPAEADAAGPEGAEDDAEGGEGGARRRRRRGGRRRRRGAGGEDGADSSEAAEGAEGDDDSEEGEAGSRRRRTRVRQPRNLEDEITSIGGSTRLEAKKQRRREGREAGRRRAPIVSEAEFLARREAVDRKMVIRQKADLTQIAVLEDKVLVEHYVARESQTSLIGNIYLGRVQNVLPSMEAAFIDIGKGRNAVLYAGEVNWSALGHVEGQPRKVESVLKSGQTILVQVTKDPVGHKGARLTGQISLPGRFLVYVPDGNTSGISRKLPDTERNRLKTLLKEIVPDTAGVIVRTAAEGASEEELTQDVERLTARWAEIEKKVAAGKSPELLYGEPDLTLKVVRDLFTEDFGKLVVQGDDAWKLVDGYVKDVAPDLAERLEHHPSTSSGQATEEAKDVFASFRIDEQISKGLDRKVWLPSGGSLVIDRTEAMTVVDVNTGKFTGSGGNLEETVTKNNLEAAEEVVRQLRLRDIGGIIVIDFIDMVLESNRDLVLRRLVECLGRDRTRHQVAEVTSLGLVQMTRKRIGSGLLEAFSEDCEHCKGRGVIVHDHPIEPSNRSVGQGGGMGGSDEPRSRRSRGGRGRSRGAAEGETAVVETPKPSPMALAGTKPHPESELIVDVEPTPELELAGHGEPSEAPAEQNADVAATETEPKGDQASADQEAAAEAPAEPAAPVVVTTTRRRRAAGRPAGPAVTPTAEQAPESDVAEPVEAPTEEPAAETVAEEPEIGAVDGPEAAEAVEVAEDEVEAAETDEETAAPMFHVPVKKRGARKR
ncbi:Rne/Rng family ribonuclease [Nocardioides marmorisolisilvae]|uniref:Ribonuclease E n=1 Tax=Nocardioides marmorisolisilvae TaxID=1542737 RepID=A0A3N0DT65_9ACTN|nr:Rne/Rng family ribonuclease [Nocardioides marmorisolisilvae]RNL78809.1 Rne/Rng family ribonuclease [Nocardioides marmorisolisilvae]